MSTLSTMPEAGEYAPYYERYIQRVPAGDLVGHLRRQGAETVRMIASLDDARALHRYEPGKWSVKEVVGHLCDGERVFSYRAMRFARKDETPLAAFEENDYVPAGNFDRRSLSSLIDELAAVRTASLVLFASFDEAAWRRTGTAAGHLVSVRALGNIILGHELHHLAILRERYGIGG